MTSDAPAKRLSIKEQGEFLTALLNRCWPDGCKKYSSITLSIDSDQVDVLRELAARLKRMAPHEDAIRRIVVGR